MNAELKGKKLLTRQETANYLGGISLPTLDKNLTKSGFPKPIRFGRRVFFSREGLDHWIEEQTGRG